MPEPRMPVLQPASTLGETFGFNILVYGPPGVGKTTLACSAQDSEFGRNVLLIDVEGGVRAIADRDDIQVLRPTNIADIQNVYDWLMENPGAHGFQTVVLDSLTAMQQLGLTEIVRGSTTPDQVQQQHYLKSTEQMQRLARAYKQLSNERGMNVIFTAALREITDEANNQVTLTRPGLTPRAAEAVASIVDCVGYMTVDANSGGRKLRFSPNARIVAKMRQPRTGAQLPLEIMNPTMVGILDIVRGGRPGVSEADNTGGLSVAARRSPNTPPTVSVRRN